MLHDRQRIRDRAEEAIFGSAESQLMLPKYRIPQNASRGEAILEMLRDELFLDGNARQNLATFCQTYADEEVRELMDLCIDKNMIDKDEYPQTAEIESRCVHMLAALWNAPLAGNPVGTSTVGSSEACMLGGLAMYFRWKHARRQAGKPTHRPNLVTGPVQVCWEKFARYWDIELRQVPMDPGRLAITPEAMLPYLDENTIGVVATLGLTFTGAYEPVEDLCRALDQVQQEKGWDLSIHVDGASGGFVAPFCAPDLAWDFRNPRVKSISASGHKFGLSPLGCGFVLWRDKADLPEELTFHVNYLGGDMAVFQLNFSRPAGPVICQYYQLLRLGRAGYRQIHMNCYKTAQYLAREIERSGPFRLLYRGDPQAGIPALTWTLEAGAEVPFNLYDFADRLRNRGWQVPAYSLPANDQDTVVQRILVRQGFGLNMARLFIEDFRRTVDYFARHGVGENLTQQEAGGFHH